MRFLSCAAPVVVAGLAPFASGPLRAQFTLQQALSAPFSNQLTAAPAKARVAWFTDEEGRRNVWVAGAHEPARAVTHNTADDGQDIDDIAWSRDAEMLAWTRGTAAAGSEHTMAANPLELPGPVKQNVEMADLRTHAVRVLAEGHAPVFLPDGSAVLFVRRGQIWIASLRDAGPAHRDGAKRPPSSRGGQKEPMSPTRDVGNADSLLVPATALEQAAVSRAGGDDESTAHADGHGTRQLLFVRGSARGLRLSPDGSQLAFVSERGDHSWIGVYRLATNALTWADPGVDLDHDPVWSPDGKRLAFVREVPIVSPIADRWLRAGAPWSVRIADAATGAGREAWRAEAGAGSLFHGVAARDQLLWMSDGSLVFPWEKTGFVQLYRLPSEPAPGVAASAVPGQADPPSQNGGVGHPGLVPVPVSLPSLPTALRPRAAGDSDAGRGEWEVDGVASDGVRIVYSANAHDTHGDDIDRRHLWLANATLGDESPKPLTVGTALEIEPALLSDGSIAYMQGWATTPFAPVLQDDPMHRNMGRLAPQLGYHYTAGQHFMEPYFVQPSGVSFPAADGMAIHGQLFLPRFCQELPHVDRARCAHLPAVVFFHGGSRRQMLLGFHPMQYYAQAYEFNRYLANRGFAVLSVNYRSGTGYGLDFRQALNYGANGASEYNDVVGAAKYLQTRPEVDGKRIGAWGGSYGGYLTALALARSSDLYAAGVDLHGVHDWSLELDLWKPTDDPDADATAIRKRAFAASPMADLTTWRSPVLLMQGDDDRNVLFAQTVRLAAALRAQGTPVEVKVYPDEVHDFLLHRNWVDAYTRAAEFLERRLDGDMARSTARNMDRNIDQSTGPGLKRNLPGK